MDSISAPEDPRTPETGLRILHVVRDLQWTGGVPEYVLGLTTELAKMGDTVTIIAGGDSAKSAYEFPEGSELEIVWLAKKRIFNRFVLLKGFLAAFLRRCGEADIVHFHQVNPLFILAACLSRAPVITTMYLHEDRTWRRRHRLLIRVAVRASAGLCAVSGAELRLIRSVASAKVAAEVVWPGVRPSTIPANTREGRLVVSIGRLAATKNHELVLKASSQIQPPTTFKIVGSGPDAERLRAEAARLGLEHEELLAGRLSEDDLRALLSEATVFVSASRQESFGIAVARAIASGARPVVSDIPSHREIIETIGLDQDCLFDPSIGADQLAHLINAALDRGPLSQECASRIPDWSDSASKLQSLYWTTH